MSRLHFYTVIKYNINIQHCEELQVWLQVKRNWDHAVLLHDLVTLLDLLLSSSLYFKNFFVHFVLLKMKIAQKEGRDLDK